MNTAGKEWCDRVAARNAIEVAKAQRTWQPTLPWCGPRNEAEAAAYGKGAANVPLSAAGTEPGPPDSQTAWRCGDD